MHDTGANPVGADLCAILLRDLASFRKEIAAYPDDASLWALPPGISNSAGTLALHCAGNLQHFLGAVLAGSGYQRNRDAEFASRDLPREALVAELSRAASAVIRALEALPESRLREPYPLEFQGRQIETGRFLLHLATHLAYHLGQADYHRRLVTGQGAIAGE
jgi:uncharacterized damage-inducible protein DinB